MARKAISKTPLGQRLTAVREKLGHAQRNQFAEMLGMNPETLGGYERGDSEPDIAFLSMYKQRFSVNLDWLLTGEGEPFTKSFERVQPIMVEPDLAHQLVDAVDRISRLASTLQQPQLPRKPQIIDVAPVRSTVKYLPQIASAGGGAVVLEESEGYDYDVEDISRNLLGILPTDLLLLKIKGDSMEPTLSERDIVVVDRSRPRPGVFPTEGKIYLVSIEGDLYAKRARYLLGGDFHWSSDNDFYDPIIVEGPRLNEEKIIGEVVWAWRRV